MKGSPVRVRASALLGFVVLRGEGISRSREQGRLAHAVAVGLREPLDQRVDDVVRSESAPPRGPVQVDEGLVPRSRAVVLEERRGQLVDLLAARRQNGKLIRRFIVTIAAHDGDRSLLRGPHVDVVVELPTSASRRRGRSEPPGQRRQALLVRIHVHASPSRTAANGRRCSSSEYQSSPRPIVIQPAFFSSWTSTAWAFAARGRLVGGAVGPSHLKGGELETIDSPPSPFLAFARKRDASPPGDHSIRQACSWPLAAALPGAPSFALRTLTSCLRTSFSLGRTAFCFSFST